MISKKIENLMLLLTEESPYVRLLLAEQSSEFPPSLCKRLAMALSDLSIGWNAASAYASAGLILPDFDWPDAVRRAWRLLTDESYRDDNLVLAHCFNLPENQAERDVIRAVLLCPKTTYEEMAQAFQYEARVFQDFEQLFWDVRDRHDLLGRAQLFGGARRTAETPFPLAQKLLRMAHKTGDVRLVLETAGILPVKPADPGIVVLANQIERDLLTLALHGQERGLVGAKNNRALALALRYLFPSKGQEPSDLPDPLFGFQITDELFAPRREEGKRSSRLRIGLDEGKPVSSFDEIAQAAGLPNQKQKEDSL